MHQVGDKRNLVEGTHHPGLGGNLLAGNPLVGNRLVGNQLVGNRLAGNRLAGSLELAAVGSLDLAGEVDSHRKAGRMLVVAHSQQEEG
jgi:hypothetical protein